MKDTIEGFLAIIAALAIVGGVLFGVPVVAHLWERECCMLWPNGDVCKMHTRATTTEDHK